MNCFYCNRELKSSADDYENCICSECKKPKYPIQRGILEQQIKIAELKQENKELKEQLDIYKEALKLDSQGYVELINRLEKDFPDIFQFDEELKDVENYSLSCLEQAKESMK